MIFILHLFFLKHDRVSSRGIDEPVTAQAGLKLVDNANVNTIVHAYSHIHIKKKLCNNVVIYKKIAVFLEETVILLHLGIQKSARKSWNSFERKKISYISKSRKRFKIKALIIPNPNAFMTHRYERIFKKQGYRGRKDKRLIGWSTKLMPWLSRDRHIHPVLLRLSTEINDTSGNKYHGIIIKLAAREYSI